MDPDDVHAPAQAGQALSRCRPCVARYAQLTWRMDIVLHHPRHSISSAVGNLGDHRGDVNYADFDGQMIEVSIEIASTPATTPSATPI